MATITTLSNPLSTVPNVVARHLDNNVFTYTIWKEIDLAAAATAKGSALAAADVIEMVRVPPSSIILAAWVEKVTALQGTVSVLTANVGISGGSGFISGADVFALAVGNQVAGSSNVVIQRSVTAGDTVDFTLASLTGTLTGGKIRMGVQVIDMNVKSRGVIATPKS